MDKEVEYERLHLYALVYYKTAPFVNEKLIDSYTHANNWQVKELVRQLHDRGFFVDVVDRSYSSFSPSDDYDLFIGLAGCGSGRLFGTLARNLKKAVKIGYLTTSHPRDFDDRNSLRYDWFAMRTGVYPERMRSNSSEVEKLSDDLAEADYMFIVGEENTFSYRSYEKFLDKRMYSLYPSTKPGLKYEHCWVTQRDRNRFVCFVGNGFIHKGVDLLVEAFLRMPGLSLTICGPSSERAFFDFYLKKIKRSSNVEYFGFVAVGSKKFYDIASSHSFVILYSSSESLATSVATMMRVGLVPVVNYETSVDVSECGVLIGSRQDDQDSAIRSICVSAQLASNFSDDEYKNLVYRTLDRSQKFTQTSFCKSLDEALTNVLYEEKCIVR